MASSSSKIRRVVQLRQMLRQWRKKAAVPAGHVAVTVGPTCKRFVIRTAYLNHPLFNELLDRAEEEYGFTNSGPLAIPCDEHHFETILRYLARAESSLKSSARFEDFRRCSHGANWADSRPLLNAWNVR